MKTLTRRETVTLIHRIVRNAIMNNPQEDGTILIGAVITDLLEESIKRS